MPSPATHSEIPVRSAEELFPLPALAYLRAAQGQRVALVCRGVGGLLGRVEALGGRLVWFFPSAGEPLERLIGDQPFDLVVEYSPPRTRAGPAFNQAAL
ncbi:MAG: hypothetical protein H7Y22_04930 [Gemmatimonadaceae bacterium]|nr:hypothetical protein [Gloeobacterales cyanobacterium ES-bin-141]